MTTPVAQRTIAICVDDFGLHDGINAAVLSLAKQRRISVTSCMTAAPRWQEGAPALRDVDPAALDVGLHLDLIEHPVHAASRKTLPQLIALTAIRALDTRLLRDEIVAQLDRFEQALGRAPSHVDGHQHVHQFPQIRDVLVDVLVARYPTARPWLRRTRRPAAGGQPRKAWVIERLGSDALSQLARRNGFAQNAHLLGVYGFDGGIDDYRVHLTRWLARAQDADLLMCHPSAATDPLDAIGTARANEFAVFKADSFDDLLRQNNVTVSPLSAIARAHDAA